MKNQLIIEVRGGVVDNILINNTNNLPEIILVDWDNIQEGGDMEIIQLPTYISDFEDYKTRLEKEISDLHSKNQEPINVDSLIGKTVKVTSATDETINSTRIGQIGVVIDKNTNGLTGNTENDPLWVVKFPDGIEEVFWTEELSVVHNF